ncbi:hypothetical protein GCM10010201_28260 [Pilimelia columellifera subsp. columellifera]|uniref:Uncharacterized protein n=1 Tax=Pilimelia columellifera subsp. columellifera TaxID=706583 RepID=A0ABN3NNM5_9ACTN
MQFSKLCLGQERRVPDYRGSVLAAHNLATPSVLTEQRPALQQVPDRAAEPPAALLSRDASLVQVDRDRVRRVAPQGTSNQLSKNWSCASVVL